MTRLVVISLALAATAPVRADLPDGKIRIVEEGTAKQKAVSKEDAE